MSKVEYTRKKHQENNSRIAINPNKLLLLFSPKIKIKPFSSSLQTNSRQSSFSFTIEKIASFPLSFRYSFFKLEKEQPNPLLRPNVNFSSQPPLSTANPRKTNSLFLFPTAIYSPRVEPSRGLHGRRCLA